MLVSHVLSFKRAEIQYILLNSLVNAVHLGLSSARSALEA